jgi:hypothetical protein
VTGAYVHLVNGDRLLADCARSYGPGLIQLGTPLEVCGHRVIPVASIVQILFDGE